MIAQRLLALHTASRQLRGATTQQKNAVLENLAGLLVSQSAKVLAANAKDIKALPAKTSAAFRDRLLLTSERIGQMAVSLRQVKALADPVGEVVEAKTLASGVKAKRVRSPLGVVFMIFESRPNVAIEAFSLAFKSGNALILRGGSESQQSTKALYALITEALVSCNLNPDVFWGISNPDRKIPARLLKERKWIDVVVPRGGEGLIEYVVKNSDIPVIKNDRGLCHVYVHEDADLHMAKNIVINAKTQRPSVCNAMETLLVHERCAESFLPDLNLALAGHEVVLYADPLAKKILGRSKNVKSALPKNWDTEYLDLKMNVKIVSSLDEAIAHIERHGSKHSEAIITRNEKTARVFQNEIDAAAVYWNASTRFTDGFEMGLGGELGISTQKLHVRGPVGLRELTNVRWILDGTGQVKR